MRRRSFLRVMAAGSAPLLTGIPDGWAAPGYKPHWRDSRFSGLDEATLAGLQAAMKTGAHTSVSLVRWYLRRIEQIDADGPALRAVIEVNPGRAGHSARARPRAKEPRAARAAARNSGADQGQH